MAIASGIVPPDDDAWLAGTAVAFPLVVEVLLALEPELPDVLEVLAVFEELDELAGAEVDAPGALHAASSGTASARAPRLNSSRLETLIPFTALIPPNKYSSLHDAYGQNR